MRLYTVSVNDGDQRDPETEILKTPDLEQAIGVVRDMVAREKFYFGVTIHGADLTDRVADYFKK